MFVPASPRYVPQAGMLVKGQLYNVSSGLGGSCTVKYTGKKGGRHNFVRKARTDWPRAEYNYTDEQIPTNVYISAPTERWAESKWDEERAAKPHYVESEKAYEAWFPPVPDSPSYKNLLKKGVITAERVVICIGSDVRECVLAPASGRYSHVLNPGWTIAPGDPSIDKINTID